MVMVLKYASNTHDKECSEHAPQQMGKMHPPALNLNSLNRDPEPALRNFSWAYCQSLNSANQEVNLTTH